MKKIKLFSLLAATLLAGTTMAAAGSTGPYSKRTIGTVNTEGDSCHWDFTGINTSSSSNLKIAEGIDEGIYYKPGNIQLAKSGVGLSCKDSSSIYLPVPSDSEGTVTMTCYSTSSNRQFDLYIGETKSDKKLVSANSSSFAFVSSDITTLDGKTYLLLRDNKTEMKVSSFSVSLTTGSYVVSTTEPWLSFSESSIELNVSPLVASPNTTVTLKGGNLTAGKYTLTVPEVAGLTVAPTSVTVADDGTVSQDITLTYTSTVDVSEATIPLSITIDEQTAQLDITYSALLTVDAITIFHWQMSGTGAPVAGTVLTATGGTIMPVTTDSGKSFGVESAGYVGGVPDDMKAKAEKGVKFGGNALSFKVALADNATFKAGDIVSICGYSPWKISSTSEHKGDLAASVVTGTDKNNYAVGQVVLTADADTLYLMRAEGSSTAIAAIKVERPTECADAEIALPENPDIEVANSALTITAPTLENPNGLVVKYVSSDAEVVAVDENTGALTKGTKTGMATITISWVRQTINTVRHCAGELAYTVTVKDGATEISNAEVYAPAQKVIRDGQLLIIRDGKTYTAQGVQVQ